MAINKSRCEKKKYLNKNFRKKEKILMNDNLIFVYILIIIKDESNLDCYKGWKENICEHSQYYNDQAAYNFTTAFSVKIRTYIDKYNTKNLLQKCKRTEEIEL